MKIKYYLHMEMDYKLMSLPKWSSMSQGYIGYQLQQCIQDKIE